MQHHATRKTNQRSMKWLCRQAVLGAAIVAGSSACGRDKGIAGMTDIMSTPPPVPAATLNAIYGTNGGLISVGTNDPMVQEAQRYYDALGTAPATFEEWKQTFGFPARRQGETLQAFRDRTDVAVYYNRNELGLGRELGCIRFEDGVDAQGAPREGVACFVTNFGPGFRQGQASLRAAINGVGVRNTVCISYRPSMEPGYEVQFYVYGAEGNRQDWAQLDTLGARPQPHVCMDCHGGAYDDAKHLAKNARFLPIDPNLVMFASGPSDAPGVTRAGQEERLRVLNVMATETPLTGAQREMLDQLYGGDVKETGRAATGDAVPAGWAGSRVDADFYRGVVRPFCGTCHLASQKGLAENDRPSYARFASAADFDAYPMQAFVCNGFTMPNAQPTLLHFWDVEGNAGVSIGGLLYPTAADAFLARRGLDRATCSKYAETAGCERGGTRADQMCGGAVSGGAVCDFDTGRCQPVVTNM
jgi:hypothetical protein